MSAPPLHVGYIVQQFPPEVGAGPARVAEMALRWMEHGARVTVFTGMPNRPEGRIHPEYRGKLFVDEDWRGIRVLRSWLYASPKHGFARTVANNVSFMLTGGVNAVARAGGVNVLIASSPPFFPHLSGRVASLFRRVPLVLEVRDLWPDYLVEMGVLRGRAASALFAVERRLLCAAAQVVVVTDSFRQRVIDKGVDPARVHVVPNGVETDQYHASDEPPPLPELERRADDEFLVGYLGNFGAGQALANVLDAAALLADSAPRVRFVLVGDGPDGEALRARAATMSNVSVHPPITKERTRAFYNACDLCLVPLAPLDIFRETIPSKLFEIMACERPLLASLGGEGAAIVQASGGGRVRRAGDACDIADGILEIMSMPQTERESMGARGRAYVQAHYSRAALADRYLDVLSNALRARAGGR
jgi:colanic acid biosynthesis glycosyl transferase WcaI